eukprot:15443410-Alexandrium_andersonii.AAC.1
MITPCVLLSPSKIRGSPEASGVAALRILRTTGRWGRPSVPLWTNWRVLASMPYSTPVCETAAPAP